MMKFLGNSLLTFSVYVGIVNKRRKTMKKLLFTNLTHCVIYFVLAFWTMFAIQFY